MVSKRIRKGRFPANLLVSDDVLNDGTVTKSPNCYIRNVDVKNKLYLEQMIKKKGSIAKNYGDSGSYSRYFDLDAWYDELVSSQTNQNDI